MRFAANGGLATLRRGAIALGLLASTAGAALAQPGGGGLLVDGVIVFDNNLTGTLAGQFSGAPVAACAGTGITAAGLFAPAGACAGFPGGTCYSHNLYVDPLLSAAKYMVNTTPLWQPGPGSPAFGNAVNLPPANNAEIDLLPPAGTADGFFQQTCFKGAIGGTPVTDDWTLGWTTYDSLGAPVPAGLPNAIYDGRGAGGMVLIGHQTWSPDSMYQVYGTLRIRSGGSLTILPGTVIRQGGPGPASTLGTIIVHRGGALNAIGTKEAPIRFTSFRNPGSMLRGDTGGIFYLGKAPTNRVNSCLGDSAQAEGGAVGYFGGADSTDASGALRYVRVEFAGVEITPNNELNSFTWGGCGPGTRADYLQAFQAADDGFEWFGGEMRATHLLAIDGTDDGIDTQLGTDLKVQFAVVRIDAHLAPSGGQFGERGIEADNNEFGFDEVQCAGRGNVQVANVTLVGDKRRGPGFGATASSQGAEFRRGTGYQLYNSIVYNFNGSAVRVTDDATWAAHCAHPPVEPAVFCPGAVGVQAPITSGNVFVARGAPNPFRNQVSFAFTLPTKGPVSVEIYAADGRHVKTVAKGEMPAGQHNLTWNIDQDTPSGMYFYKVLASGQTATGKITRVD